MACVVALMMTDKTKIAITADHIGCRRGQARFADGGLGRVGGVEGLRG